MAFLYASIRPAQVEDRLEVERDGADAELAGAGEGRRVTAGDPDRRVALAVRLGQHVVRGRHGEVLAVELVVHLLPHPRDLLDDLFPLGLGRVLVEDVEGGHLVAAGAAAGAPLEAPVGDVVEHRGPLGVAHRVLLARREAVDAGRQVDVVGVAGDVTHDDLGRRHVAVLGQRVVLAEPGVLPVVLVGEDRVLGLPHQAGVLRLACREPPGPACSR